MTSFSAFTPKSEVRPPPRRTRGALVRSLSEYVGRTTNKSSPSLSSGDNGVAGRRNGSMSRAASAYLGRHSSNVSDQERITHLTTNTDTPNQHTDAGERFSFTRMISGLGQSLASIVVTTSSSNSPREKSTCESLDEEDDNDKDEVGDEDNKNDNKQQKDKQCFDNKKVGFSIHDLGKERAEEGNWKEAILAWENSLKIFQNEYRTNNNIGTVKLYKKIGLGYWKLGNVTKAYECFTEAIRIRKDIGLQRDNELEMALTAVEELKKAMSNKAIIKDSLSKRAETTASSSSLK